MSKGGWTRIMNRVKLEKGNLFFNRTWQDYKNGFGSIEDNYWMGLENMRNIIGNKRMQLRIEMFNKNDQIAFLVYDYFNIDSESNSYKLTIWSKTDGNTYDTLSYHNSMKFSTFDRDNDQYPSDSCAKDYNGGWWFNYCYKMCPTCKSTTGESYDGSNHIFFDNIKMMIKPGS